MCFYEIKIEHLTVHAHLFLNKNRFPLFAISSKIGNKFGTKTFRVDKIDLFCY